MRTRIKPSLWFPSLLVGLACALFLGATSPDTRTESFDHDPHWDEHNNRSQAVKPLKIVQNFGYSLTANAGGRKGEAGGAVMSAAEGAYYALKIDPLNFDSVLTASGKLNVALGSGQVMLGFFNSKTLNEWRTPNTFVLRFGQEGDSFVAYLEYGTSRWRAGGALFRVDGQTKKKPELIRFPAGKATHNWLMKYDPAGNSGGGTITATIDDKSVTADLTAGHKADGAMFDRFGLLNMMRGGDDRGGSFWVDDVMVNGKTESFDREPAWESVHNRRTYTTTYVRPRFDFGFSSATHFAGGGSPGEMGGLVFRGDEQFAERMAYYGDRLDSLNLEKALKASGKIGLKQAVTDSMTLIGFFHSTDSMRISHAQKSISPENFMGMAVEGPSDEGFYLYPYYATSAPDQRGQTYGQQGLKPPHIFPDGKPHDWSFEYQPDVAGQAQMIVTLDGQSARMTLPPADKAIGAHFDRFGIITTHVDGNGQRVFFDDLTYTVRQ